MANRKWSDEELAAAVAASKNVAMVLRKLGLREGSRAHIQAAIDARALDTTHFEDRFLDVSHVSPRARTRWSDESLRSAVASSRSYAQVIRRLGLVPAGGNYDQVQRRIRDQAIDTSHFTSQAWNAGGVPRGPSRPLQHVLVAGRLTASHNLKRRLFRAGLKHPRCELCGWAERAPDGRIPVELDHINGDKTDNRLENLRVVCPNCHSLQPTHRGLNKRKT